MMNPTQPFEYFLFHSIYAAYDVRKVKHFRITFHTLYWQVNVTQVLWSLTLQPHFHDWAILNGIENKWNLKNHIRLFNLFELLESVTMQHVKDVLIMG